MSACAQTVYTIVQIAGKPAMFPWRAPVATETHSIRMQIEADTRLAAAAGGAARYLADAAGLEDPAMSEWQTAIVAACREAFAHLTREHPRLNVSFTRLADRLEVALSREGDASPALGIDSLAGLVPRSANAEAQPHTNSPVLGGVDSVQYETRDGVAVTRLTKYIAPTSPRR
jgi:hypothetical protein